MQGLFDDEDDNKVETGSTVDQNAPDQPFVLSNYTPPTQAEAMRQTGLAYTIGIAFFVAIVFMGFLGWLADQLLGYSPWGIVGGIVLGAIIGFMQIFRISSKIFKNNDPSPAEYPLLSHTQKPSERTDRFDQPR